MTQKASLFFFAPTHKVGRLPSGLENRGGKNILPVDLNSSQTLRPLSRLAELSLRWEPPHTSPGDYPSRSDKRGQPGSGFCSVVTPCVFSPFPLRHDFSRFFWKMFSLVASFHQVHL